MRSACCVGIVGLVCICSVACNMRTPQLPQAATPEELSAQMMAHIIGAALSSPMAAKLDQSQLKRMGDGAAIEIIKFVGDRPLTRDEQIAVLTVLRQAYSNPMVIRPALRKPQATLFLLRHIEAVTHESDVTRQVSDVRKFVIAAASPR